MHVHVHVHVHARVVEVRTCVCGPARRVQGVPCIYSSGRTPGRYNHARAHPSDAHIHNVHRLVVKRRPGTYLVAILKTMVHPRVQVYIIVLAAAV